MWDKGLEDLVKDESCAKFLTINKSIDWNSSQLQSERNDFPHDIAKQLLRMIFYKLISKAQNDCMENIDIIIEASRIIASNLIISQCLNLSVEEVTLNPKLGVTCISNKHLNNPEAAHRIFELVHKKVPEMKSLPILDDLRKLERYHLVKILEAVHEVAVYMPYECIAKDEITSSLHVNKVNGMRKQRGAFYTPIEITEFICENTVGRFLDYAVNRIEQAIDKAPISINEIFNEMEKIFRTNIVDPACGAGAFLSSSLQVLKFRRVKFLEICKRLQTYPLSEEERIHLNTWMEFLKSEDMFLKYFASRMYGVDLDSSALEIASICLSILSNHNPLSEGLKIFFGVNLKEGNSLISELPPKSVRLSPNELRTLLDFRNKLRNCCDLDEKRKIMREYKSMAMQFIKCSKAPHGVKRASHFFKDLGEKGEFCWELEFPEVFYNNEGIPSFGFELLVMNPPYDLLKPNKLEFARLYGIKEPSRALEFENFKKALKEEVAFYRYSGHYSLSISNVLNLYKLMLERALYITSESGMLGFIVPSTLLCDESAVQLRREILCKYKIEGVYDFIESARVFQGVSQAVCIVIINKSERGKYVPLATGLTKIADLKRVVPYHVPLSWIKIFSGFRIPKVTDIGWKILEKIHVNPRLSDIPWILNLRGEVDLTFYRDCLSRENTGAQLIRGSDISRYILRRSSSRKEGFILREKFLKMLGNSIKAKHVFDKRIAGQQISNMMQRWRLKFCLVEAGKFLGNSCNYIYINEEREERELWLLYLLAILNSSLLNWRFKLTSTNNHVSNTELGMLPIKLIEISNWREKSIFDLITQRVKSIIEEGVSRFDPLIEAAIFFLYGLTTDEVVFILRSESANEYEIRNVLEHFNKLNELSIANTKIKVI